MLKECLNSIIRQTYTDFEVIVGNDYPGDTLSNEVLGIDDSRIRFINHAQNIGEMENMNFLLRMSRGRYFTWLADDDAYAPVFLESVYRSLLQFSNPVCVFTSFVSDATVPELMEKEIKKGQIFDGRQFLRLYLNHTFKIQGSCGVFNKEYLVQVGGMNKLGNGFGPYADNLLAIRSGLLDRVAFINAPLVFFRTHSQSISWTNTDVDAYRKAQEDLLSKSCKIFKSEKLNGDFRSNLYLLLSWCLNDFFSVMRRSGSLQSRKMISYLMYVMRYSKLLGDYWYPLIFTILYGFGRLVKTLTLTRIKRDLE